jgi:FMN phosphatase YigB (HAD superfamily)
VFGVNELVKRGYTFGAITSLSEDVYAGKMREYNLQQLFGDVFDFIDCALDFSVGKEQYLLDRYGGKDYYWIEDSVNHAQAGQRVGLRSVLIDHPYNQDWDGPRVKNWKQVYQIITNANTSH